MNLHMEKKMHGVMNAVNLGISVGRILSAEVHYRGTVNETKGITIESGCQILSM